nr:hypothetical protein Iba_chr01bCG7220 [Ipomoea batatas]
MGNQSTSCCCSPTRKKTGVLKEVTHSPCKLTSPPQQSLYMLPSLSEIRLENTRMSVTIQHIVGQRPTFWTLVAAASRTGLGEEYTYGSGHEIEGFDFRENSLHFPSSPESFSSFSTTKLFNGTWVLSFIFAFLFNPACLLRCSSLKLYVLSMEYMESVSSFSVFIDGNPNAGNSREAESPIHQ